MKKIKSMLCVLLAAVLLLGVSVPVTAAVNGITAKLYNIYQNKMLFQQNETATLAGTAANGSEISCKLFDSKNNPISNGKSKTGNDGIFRVTFDAPAGGYEAYRIEVYENGTLFAQLTDVLFGELWLASGQSNMHIFLCQSDTGAMMYQNHETGSPYVRFLDIPLWQSYNGSVYHIPQEPLTDIEGAKWFDGSSENIYTISAVAYYFAEKMQKDLDVPVGILCDYLGGTAISTWLSREAVEQNKEVKKIVGDDYIPDWKYSEAEEYSILSTVAAMYNKKTAALGNFKIAGMIWYQGESDSYREHGEYTVLFNELQNMLTQTFHYTNGKLPVVCSLLANFRLGSDLNDFQRLNAEFGEIQQADPTSRAVISISDIPLTYTSDTQAIHPVAKKPIGERLATAAQNLVYKTDYISASSPVFKSAAITNGGIEVTFDNVADGLAINGDVLIGFSLCGKDGCYLPADACIIGKDKVFVKNENIKNPKGVMYSQGLITTRCNLVSTLNGSPYLPACPLISDWKKINNIWQDFGFNDFEQNEIWRSESVDIAGYYKIWQGDNADVQITDNAYKGNGCLEIRAEKQSFGVHLLTEYENPSTQSTAVFQEFNSNWKSYGTVSVMVKNDGNTDVTLQGLKLTTSDGKTVSPVVQGTKSCAALIPVDGTWHKITFDLTDLIQCDSNTPVIFDKLMLKDIIGVSFSFSAKGSASLVSMDDLTFTSASDNCAFCNLENLLADIVEKLLSALSKVFDGLSI